MLNLITSLVYIIVGPGGPHAPLPACVPLHFSTNLFTKSKQNPDVPETVFCCRCVFFLLCLHHGFLDCLLSYLMESSFPCFFAFLQPCFSFEFTFLLLTYVFLLSCCIACAIACLLSCVLAFLLVAVLLPCFLTPLRSCVFLLLFMFPCFRVSLFSCCFLLVLY